MCEEMEDLCAPGRSPCQHQSTCLITSSGPKYVCCLQHDIATYWKRFACVLLNYRIPFAFSRCVCSPGYVGDDCSLDYNDCEEHRCQNGAQCMDELNGYSCICPEGYRWEEHKQAHSFGKLAFICYANDTVLTRSLNMVLSVAVSCARFPHPRCPCVSWPTVRITPRVWSEEDVPSASVLLNLGGHAVRSWSASTL